MDAIPITDDHIRLGQFLKLAGVIEQGSDAKILLADQRVKVNGELEVRRGRQLSRGDQVAIDGHPLLVG
jgi:ribosome-associated protein